MIEFPPTESIKLYGASQYISITKRTDTGKYNATLVNINNAKARTELQNAAPETVMQAIMDFMKP